VYYCCFETRFLALAEEHRLRVFENRVQRIIFRLERDEVAGRHKTLKCTTQFVADVHRILLGVIRSKNDMI
jgi:hypothetical protein